MDLESPLTYSDLLSCLELSKSLTAELDSKRLFQKILQKVSALLPAEVWSLLLLDEAAGELRFEISVDLDLEKLKNFRLPLGEGIAGQVALKQEPMIITDVRTCELFSKRVDQLSNFTTKSLICVPVIYGGRTLGVIEVVNPRDLGARAVALVKLIAGYTAIAVENANRYQHIQNLAIHDNLTGLFNTRYLYQSLTELIEAGKTANSSLSLIFMDLDHFKEVVDTHGHLNGSRAIQQVALTIQQSLEDPAYAVAYAGDEFVVVLPGFDRARARQKADEINSRIMSTVYLFDQEIEVRLQVSFGIATFPEDGSDLTSLLGRADRELFAMKQGRIQARSRYPGKV
ncbi:MAG: sensor domain-containing diguanylate cyclase [Deltaproteobacteria bacterium]